MDSEIYSEHPWQQGPTELIEYAIEHLERKTNNIDFNKRIAFLMLDIGVETLFKVYLMLPDEVIKTKVDYRDRCSAVKSGFHRLIQCVRKCAGNKLNNIDMNHVIYFHNIRNKLYHESDSITIPHVTARKYADLSVKLLKVLLDVDLTEHLRKIYNEQLMNNNEVKSQEERKALRNLYSELELCMEKLSPNMLLPSFKNALIEIDPSEPATAMRVICNLIEQFFSIDNLVEHFSEKDIEFVNNYLMETSGTEISQYPSQKDIVITVTSGFIGWEYTTIKNLPVGKYKINNLTFDDFLQVSYNYNNEEEMQKGFTFLFSKIVCGIIDHEVSQGIYDKQLISLTEKMKGIEYYPILNIGSPISSDKKETDALNDRVNAIKYIHETIKAWRKERL